MIAVHVESEAKNPDSLAPLVAIGGNFDDPVSYGQFTIVEILHPVTLEVHVLESDRVGHCSPEGGAGLPQLSERQASPVTTRA